MINSTNAYRLGNSAPQFLHFPPSKKYETIGILSIALMGPLQLKQCDLGFMILICLGTLYITTLRKLPNEAPIITKKKTKNGIGKSIML